MKFDNQLRYAVEIIGTFRGEMPLHNWLKNFFRQHRQMGSNDRKQLSEMVFCFYRLGHTARSSAIEERILAGLFLCHRSPNEVLKYFKPEWSDKMDWMPGDKIAICRQSSVNIIPEEIFPWKGELSAGIDHERFCSSFLQQPLLFLRLRPGFEIAVQQKLRQSHIDFETVGNATLALSNNSRLDDILQWNKEAVVQDLNSQKAGSILSETDVPNHKTPLSCWDCCAGSGGKSILLHDLYPGLELTVSDIRESALANLGKRFEEAGIRRYRAFTADLTLDNIPPGAGTKTFDLVLADVPCSGSGTWCRTPDELYFFDIRQTERYHALQEKIISHVVPRLKKGGCLLYITCSVFRKENENSVAFIRDELGLKIYRQQLLKGYDRQADSLFTAVCMA